MTTPISEHQYTRLLAHASNERDFVYVGSVGKGAGRGTFSGFSAYASESRTLSRDAGAAEIQALIEDMESIVSDYQLTRGGHKECLKGGWIGLLSYELGYAREKHLAALCPPTPVPLVSAGFYLWTASFNRRTETYYLWVHPQCPANVRQILESWLNTEPAVTTSSWTMPSPFIPLQSPETFKASVRAIRDYIEAGDCYQANLSQEFQGKYQGDPWTAFQALAEANPTPYSAFIRAGNDAVLSISPERFLEIHGNRVTTSPIKGTRPRGGNPEEDAALANELETSDKDRAENLMIVDLLRNDLSLNSATGSVVVDKLFALESYRNVHHLVSHIHAELAPGVTPLKALFDAFPGGSITGAPKIRAMEIIRELEPHWRGPYCGSVFYRGLDGTLDSNIGIRTMLCEGDGTIRCWGGGGIVSDSEPESEYQETLTKVRPLMEFLEKL
ncbi:aminodeoxychorismate synthase component I [Marinobacter sp. F4206]|uniref:aminodeoxychorismate synthase component I n=1 Tax=Marinobacter sp. F4206 TaxID=2861777 RepID=UPI0027E478F9|nr:aminodeoxychorismate synthase component I [Marinobacter sp. F4206]